jgi:serpin B
MIAKEKIEKVLSRIITKKKILFGIFTIAIVIAAGWLILSYQTEVAVSNPAEESAIEIAEKNETVKQYLNQGYEISEVGLALRNNETGVTVMSVLLTKDSSKESRLGGGVSAYVNLKEGKVVGIEEEGAKEFRLTEEEEKKAKQIALSDPEVREKIEGRDYEIDVDPLAEIKLTDIPLSANVSKIGSIQKKIGASVDFEFSDGTTLSVLVNLKKEEVIRIEEVEHLDFVEADDTGATPEKVNAVVNANNQFAFELYSKYKDEYRDDNIFFSPYSISTALAMTYEGARGKTSGEMQSVFHFPENSDVRRPAFAKIYNEINKKEKGKQYKLHTANALWAQKDCQFLNEYFGTTEKYYRGKVTNLDFRSEPEPSRITINNWVEDQTNDKIKDLIPSGGICPLTRLVLTNAIYFKGTWVLQFNKNKTREADFGVSPTKTVKAEMMSLTGEKAKFNYAETAHLQILEMPYEGEELSMIVLLPKEDTLDKLEQSLTVEKLNEWRGMLQKERVDVYMPKFKFETKYFMAQDLAEMGMPSAFTGEADFSGMTGKRDLYISQVIHQAFVEVNEEGTEAAAATAAIMEEGAVMSKVFRADHPFIFIIQQKDTGNILFLGKVVDPAK